MLFFKKVGDNLTALNAVTDEIGPAELNNIQELTYYIVGLAGVVSGAVQVEEAHVVAYPGTWAPNGGPTTVTADAVKTTKVSGVSFVSRVRVSTVMGGAGVDVWALGR